MAQPGQALPAAISLQPEDVHPLLINGGVASGAWGVQVNQRLRVQTLFPSSSQYSILFTSRVSCLSLAAISLALALRYNSSVTRLW